MSNECADESLEFVISQVIQTARCLDVSDEAGRKRLSSILGAIISETALSSDIMEQAVISLHTVSPCANEFLSSMETILKTIGSAVEISQDENAKLLTQFKSLEIMAFLLEITNEVIECFCLILNVEDKRKYNDHEHDGVTRFSLPGISYLGRFNFGTQMLGTMFFK